MLREPVYLDYAATTPVAPEVAERMQACLTREGCFANPASRSHRFGWEAEERVETARLQVAELIGAEGRDIIWTSGATESDNLALKGVMERAGQPGHLVVSSTEHKAVLDAAGWLEQQGWQVTRVPVTPEGQVTPDALAGVLTDETCLVSIMQVNNETGTINDIAALGALCRERDILFHVDAAQSAGRLPIDVQALPVDLMSLSAHKMYGPKGVGALYVAPTAKNRLSAQIHGGGHEQGLRSGTLPTHQCVGMGRAAEMARSRREQDVGHIGRLRDRLWEGISALPGVRINGHPEKRVCSHLNVVFPGQEGESLLMALADVAVSTGSACTSARVEPSFVLKAMGISDADARASLRFSVGRYTTQEEIDHAIAHICDVVTRLQAVSA